MFQKLSGREPDFLDGDRYRRFAVAAPFLPEREAFLFQVRSGNLRRQPGEICFPGGRIEAGETPLDAALRETAEELLVSPGCLEVVAPLDRLVTPYDTMVHPYLVSLNGYSGSFSRDEVAEVFEVPFEYFLRTEPLVYYNRVSVAPEDPAFPYEELLGAPSYPWGTGRYPVLFYRYGGRVIWGMTAKFMRNIVELYRSAENDHKERTDSK